MRTLWKSSFVTFLLVALDVIALSIIWREAWEIRNALSGWRGLPAVNPYTDYREAFPLLLLVWLGIMSGFYLLIDLLVLAFDRSIVHDFMREAHTTADPLWMLWLVIVLISPAFDLPTVAGTERLELRFWQWFNYNGCYSFD